jgi:hypothetical protein
MNILHTNTLNVCTIGVDTFSAAIVKSGGKAVSVAWVPPAGGDLEAAEALEYLYANPLVEEANQKALEAFLAAEPALVGVSRAGDVIPGMTGKILLHAGPPVSWENMCGPMQGGIIGAIVFEGWATNIKDAEALASSGQVAFEPCHHHSTVGPMAGIVSPSMPVWISQDMSTGKQAFSTFNEGLGKVLRFGANSPEVLERLAWIRDELAPACAKALTITGPINLKPLIAQALHMGDEVHNRNSAATGLIFKKLISSIIRSGLNMEKTSSVADFIVDNDHFFLNISMTACKIMCDAAACIPNSTFVTAMCRNGVEFGIRVSGLKDIWFTSQAPVVNGLFFPGYGIADAAPDLGDSAITETAGVGGFAMAAAPAIVKFVDGTAQDAIANTMEMVNITIGRNTAFTLPALNFAGTPAGIDLRLILDTNILPVINTGIAHKQAGVGQIGAGVTRAPMECFTKAAVALAKVMRQNAAKGADNV